MDAVRVLADETPATVSLEVLHVRDCIAQLRSVRELAAIARFGGNAEYQPGFRYDPRADKMADFLFMSRMPSSAIGLLAWLDPDLHAESAYSTQMELVDFQKVRPVSAAEAIQFSFRYFQERRWTGEKPHYPDLGWTWLLTDDLVKPEEWPNWYRLDRHLVRDLRVAVRFDQINGVVIDLVPADRPVANGVIAVTW